MKKNLITLGLVFTMALSLFAAEKPVFNKKTAVVDKGKKIELINEKISYEEAAKRISSWFSL